MLIFNKFMLSSFVLVGGRLFILVHLLCSEKLLHRFWWIFFLNFLWFLPPDRLVFIWLYFSIWAWILLWYSHTNWESTDNWSLCFKSILKISHCNYSIYNFAVNYPWNLLFSEKSNLLFNSFIDFSNYKQNFTAQ